MAHSVRELKRAPADHNDKVGHLSIIFEGMAPATTKDVWVRVLMEKGSFCQEAGFSKAQAPSALSAMGRVSPTGMLFCVALCMRAPERARWLHAWTD